MPASFKALVDLTAAAGLALALAACGPSAGDKTSQASSPAGTGAPNPALAALPAPFNAADVDHGKAVFAQCRACHTTEKGGANMVGPNLHGVFGRKAGVEPADFKHSEQLKATGIVWDAASLDKWLTDPQADVPGAKMVFAGLPDAKDRIDVIGYLKVATGDQP